MNVKIRSSGMLGLKMSLIVSRALPWRVKFGSMVSCIRSPAWRGLPILGEQSPGDSQFLHVAAPVGVDLEGLQNAKLFGVLGFAIFKRFALLDQHDVAIVATCQA